MLAVSSGQSEILSLASNLTDDLASPCYGDSVEPFPETIVESLSAVLGGLPHLFFPQTVQDDTLSPGQDVLPRGYRLEANRTWTQVFDLGPDLGRRHAAGVALDDGVFWITGGIRYWTASATSYPDMETILYDHKTGGVSAGPPLNGWRHSHAMVMLDANRTLIAGGERISSDVPDEPNVAVYNWGTDSWEGVGASNGFAANSAVARYTGALKMVPVNGEMVALYYTVKYDAADGEKKTTTYNCLPHYFCKCVCHVKLSCSNYIHNIQIRTNEGKTCLCSDVPKTETRKHICI